MENKIQVLVQALCVRSFLKRAIYSSSCNSNKGWWNCCGMLLICKECTQQKATAICWWFSAVLKFLRFFQFQREGHLRSTPSSQSAFGLADILQSWQSDDSVAVKLRLRITFWIVYWVRWWFLSPQSINSSDHQNKRSKLPLCTTSSGFGYERYNCFMHVGFLHFLWA